MNAESDTRDETLRRMLVATVYSEPVAARPRWRVVAASVAAFALAGALTGGALASVATASGEVAGYGPFEIGPPPNLDDVEVLSSPIVLAGRETGSFDLGTAPAGANALAFGIYCLETGSFRANLDGVFTWGLACTPEEGGPSTGGAGSVETFDGDVPRELTVEVDSGAYAVWVAWVYQAPYPDPSVAQQEALADGVVTRDEYVASYAAYVACMAELGFDVAGVDTGEGLIRYTVAGSEGQDGAAYRCYLAEFSDVDSAYQESLWE